MAKGATREYNHGAGIFSLIFMTAGIYFLVAGFFTQAGSPVLFWNWSALLYYLVGIILFGVGKVLGMKGYCC